MPTPMPPHRYPDTGQGGPWVVYPDRCPAGHRHRKRPNGPGVEWMHVPVRPGNPRDYWLCSGCQGRRFDPTPDLYDDLSWWDDPLQVRRRAEGEVMERERLAHRRRIGLSGG